MQGLESYINDLPSKDEVDALKYKLTDKSEKLDRLQSRLGEFELGGAALNKRNFILEENCKQLDLKVRLRSYILSAHAAKEWSGTTTAKKLILPPLKDKLEDMDISLHLRATHMGPMPQT